MRLTFEIADWKAVWRGIRQVFGDAAYENYLRSQQRIRGEADARAEGGGGEAVCEGERRGPDHAHVAAPLTREEFYLDSLRRRYSGVSRCC